MHFMSMRLLDASETNKKVIHTALDDLESFLWLLIWGIFNACKDIDGSNLANPGMDNMRIAWSGGLSLNKNKYYNAEYSWRDAVFGDLIKEWLGIFRRTHMENDRFTENMSGLNLKSKEWEDVCNELESYCQDIYKEVLESGFKHLDGVSQYVNWDKVVTANARKFLKNRSREAGTEGELVLEDAGG